MVVVVFAVRRFESYPYLLTRHYLGKVGQSRRENLIDLVVITDTVPD